MLIEQIVELQWRGPGPQNGPQNHLQLNFNTKMQDVKRVLNLNCN